MSPSSQLSSLLFPGSYQSAQHMDTYELKSPKTNYLLILVLGKLLLIHAAAFKEPVATDLSHQISHKWLSSKT